MNSLSEKMKAARAELNISQAELAERTGMSKRIITAYEMGEKYPRETSLRKLAKALGVSVKFLKDNNCTNPQEEIEKDGYIEQAHTMYGAKGARDVDALLRDNAALFAGGELSQEQKDVFFEAVMKAYLTCKEKAREKYGHKS